jgi:hypothetical protein
VTVGTKRLIGYMERDFGRVSGQENVYHPTNCSLETDCSCSRYDYSMSMELEVLADNMGLDACEH